MENQRSSVRAAVHACPNVVSHAMRELGKELIYRTSEYLKTGGQPRPFYTGL